MTHEADGDRLLADKPGKDAFCDHWVVLPLRLYVRDRSPRERPVRLGLRAGQEQVSLETVGNGFVRVESGMAANPDATIAGSARQILLLLTGKASLAELGAKGLRYQGDAKLLARFTGR
jgi:hypothetical protein